MVNLYIKFQKEKEKDPDFVVPEKKEDDGGIFSLRNVVYGYVGYVALTSGPVAFRNWVADQEAAGKWHGSGIQFVDDWLAKKADVAAETVQAVSDAVQSSSGMQ